MASDLLNIDIWSDVVCPFCYIGKRHLEQALEGFPQLNTVELRWHSFQLDPNTPRDSTQDTLNVLMAKYGMSQGQVEAMMGRVQQMGAAAGLDLKLPQTLRTNTFDAHRLLQLAKGYGKQSEAKERLLAAYFTELRHLGQSDTLVALMAEIGLPAAEVAAVLTSERFSKEVLTDQAQAQEMGISGVPYFVFNQQVALSGAQPVAVFQQAIRLALENDKPTVSGPEVG